MTRLNATKTRANLSVVLNRAAYRNKRTIVSRRGQDLAAIISIDHLRLLERLEQAEMDRQDVTDARAALREAKLKGTSLSVKSCAHWN